MSSAPKGRYQSRLFNFFHKQSRRFGERFGRSLRQLQVATNWSLEAVAKSIYLLIQKAVDSVGTQLPASVEESKLQLQPSEESPLAADTAITRVLENVQTQYITSPISQTENYANQSKNMVLGPSCSLSNQENGLDIQQSQLNIQQSQEKIQQSQLNIQQSHEKIQQSQLYIQQSQEKIQNSQLDIEQSQLDVCPSEMLGVNRSCDLRTTMEYSSKKIRGIASQISSQNLVLVTSENEILDILTPSQQKALENRIISEIANYWRSWRLSQQVNKKTKLLSRVENFLQRLSPANPDTTKALPIVNARQKEYKYLQINPDTLASLDTVVAKLETNALVPISSAQLVVRQRSGEIIKAVRDKLDIFLYGNQQVTPSRKQIVADGNVADDNLETQKSKIQALIRAALNYFYREPTTKKLQETPPRSNLSSSKSKTSQLLQSEQKKDAWLTFNDLFGNDLFGGESTQLSQENQASNKLETSQKQLKPATEINNPDKKQFRRFQIPNWLTLQLQKKAGFQKRHKSIQKTIQKIEKDVPIKGSRENFLNKQSIKDARTINNKISSVGKTSIDKTSRISQKIQTTPASESQNQNKGEITQTQTPESTQVEAKPECIETKAEIVGYQKHPLEQILGWIDSAMLKIEEVFVKFASALRQLWRK